MFHYFLKCKKVPSSCCDNLLVCQKAEGLLGTFLGALKVKTLDSHLILVVDSDRKFLDIMTRMVRLGGFEPAGKDNWTEGISFVKENDVFLLMTPICFLKPSELVIFKTIKDLSPKTVRGAYTDTNCKYSNIGKCSFPNSKSKINSLLKDGLFHEYFNEWDVTTVLKRIRHWFDVYNKS